MYLKDNSLVIFSLNISWNFVCLILFSLNSNKLWRKLVRKHTLFISLILWIGLSVFVSVSCSKWPFLHFFILDPTLESFHDYLLAACKYFNQQKAFKTLVTFQIFMKDYVRAGLTCIKIFLDTLDHTYKLKCLEVAKVQRFSFNNNRFLFSETPIMERKGVCMCVCVWKSV
jgi:hypothetical protein